MPIGGGKGIALMSDGQTVTLELMRNSRHVAFVTISWTMTSEKAAKAFVEKACKESIRERIKYLSFCAEFVEQLEEALISANTKKATKPIDRTYGSNANGRYGLRNTPSSRVYTSR